MRGVAARTQLVVLARALPIAAALMLVALWENGRQDRAHQRTYAAAAADPVADKLGADWPAHYFKPAQEVVERFRAKAAGKPAPETRAAPAGPGG